MASFATKGNQGPVTWETGSIWVGGVAPAFDGSGNNSDDITIAAGDAVAFGGGRTMAARSASWAT